MAELTFIQNLVLLVGGIFATAISGVIVYHYTKKAECFTNLKNTTYTAKKDIDRIKKFLAIQSRMIDESTKHNHPQDAMELERLAKQMFDEK